MNKVTSIAILNTNGMQRISITYSSIDENGVITEDNKRINRVVVDEDKLKLVSQLYEFADSIVQTNK